MFSRLKNKNVGIFGCNFVTLIIFGCNFWDCLMLFGWLFLVIYFALCLRMDEGYYSGGIWMQTASGKCCLTLENL